VQSRRARRTRGAPPLQCAAIEAACDSARAILLTAAGNFPMILGGLSIHGTQRNVVRRSPGRVLMKAHTDYLWFNTRKKREFINITPEVEKALSKSGIREGLVLASAMHITAGVYINDAEDGLIADIEEWLEKLAPFRADYRHHRTGETNGDAHLKNLLVGHQVLVPVTEGKLDLGPWQQVYYAEFDGQRRKRVLIKVIGE
jgi:secondary thiamine-phosphate synthase enzyme